MDKRHALIHENNLVKSILKLSLPVMLINLVMTFYNLADAFFVSNISTTHFAAISIVFPVVYAFSAIGIGLKVGSSSLMAQSIGAKDYKEASRIFSIALVIALILSVFITFLGYLFVPFVINKMSSDTEMVNLAIKYTQIVILGTPFLFLFTIYQGQRQALGDTLSPVLIQICAVLVNVVLDYFFILKFNYGIEGAAVATVISQFLLVPYVLFNMFKKDVVVFSFKVDYKSFNYKRFFHISIPAMLNELFMSLSFMILNSNAVSFGTSVLAASAAGNRINSILQIPITAFSQVLGTFVGQLYGSKNFVRARKSFYVVIKLSIVFGLLMAFILYIFDDFVLQLFLKDIDENLFIFAKRYLVIVNLNMVILTCLFAAISTLNSFGKTRISFVLNVARLWIFRIPLFYILKDSFGIETIWISMFISTLVTSSIGFYVVSNFLKNLVLFGTLKKN